MNIIIFYEIHEQCTLQLQIYQKSVTSPPHPAGPPWPRSAGRPIIKGKWWPRIATLSSHGSIANGISMFRDHTPGGDRRCRVDTDVSACSSLLPGVYICHRTNILLLTCMTLHCHSSLLHQLGLIWLHFYNLRVMIHNHLIRVKTQHLLKIWLAMTYYDTCIACGIPLFHC